MSDLMSQGRLIYSELSKLKQNKQFSGPESGKDALSVINQNSSEMSEFHSFDAKSPAISTRSDSEIEAFERQTREISLELAR